MTGSGQVIKMNTFIKQINLNFSAEGWPYLTHLQTGLYLSALKLLATLTTLELLPVSEHCLINYGWHCCGNEHANKKLPFHLLYT